MTVVTADHRHHQRVHHDDHPDRRTVARERRVAQAAHGLDALLARRPELAEVCPWAAFAVDAVRWST